MNDFICFLAFDPAYLYLYPRAVPLGIKNYAAKGEENDAVD
ncbi:MAG: hypothetical protein ABSG67_07110 [Thermoguttaceae bacterium]|jgi:hypothetical protein